MWITALMLGLAGSLHCAGMCSPLAFAVSRLSANAVLNRLLYNGGRIAAYGITGAFFSGVGAMIPIAAMQNVLSISLGLVLVIVAFAGLPSIRIPILSTIMTRLTVSLKSAFGKYLRKRSYYSVVLLGSLNGLLPCGLTFVALLYCISLRGPLDGFNFMLLFGLGTIPVMLGAHSILSFVTKHFQVSAARVNASLMLFAGIALITRVFLVAGREAALHGDSLVDAVLCR